jgi:hypothetical protein
MANTYRGQTPFKALGREPYIVYGTREIAEAWTALGFRRPDPLAPPMVEDRDEPMRDRATGDPVLDEQGLQRFVRTRAYLDAAGRQQRVQEAFDACFSNPDVPARRTCIRIGLQRWEKEVGKRLTDDEFEQLCDELGVEGLAALHVGAFINAVRTPPVEGTKPEGRDPNAPSAEPASSTSSTS